MEDGHLSPDPFYYSRDRRQTGSTYLTDMASNNLIILTSESPSKRGLPSQVKGARLR